MRDWVLASPWGSLRQGDRDDPAAAFHAGHVNDALRLNSPPANPLLVASDTSGVWLVEEHGGPALPLSEGWTQPNLQCLAQGVRGPMHVYAAGSALYETDTMQPAPLLAWRPIPIRDADDATLSVGQILAIAVVRERGAIVLATDTGIWWAAIPPGGGVNYTFSQAQLLPGVPMPGRRYSGVAEGPANRVVAACWGSDLATGFGIFLGDWGGPGGNLQFTARASIFGVDERKMLCTKITSFPKDRKQMYAVCSGSGVVPTLGPNGRPTPDGVGGLLLDGDDFILAVLRSKDGGQSWSPTSADIRGQTLPLFPGGPGSDAAGHTMFGYNLCIGVSPFHEDLVAVGVGAPFLSTDGGQSWDAFAPETSAHRHADTHACVFDVLDPAMLHVCSDGGIATTSDLGGSWTTASNRQLPNLQFRRFAVSAHDDGLLAGSLQDNGDVFAALYPGPDPWRTLPEDGGDGVLSVFLTTGELVHHNNFETLPDAAGVNKDFGSKPRACTWDGETRLFSDLALMPDFPFSLGVIPLDGTADGLVSNALTGYANVVEAVLAPDGRNLDGDLMQAVGAEAEAVYGLYQRADATLHWQALGPVKHDPPVGAGPTPGTTVELPYFATAAASLDGHSALVGMNNGKIYQLAEPLWDVTDLSDPSISEQVARLLPLANDNIFAIAGAEAFRWDGMRWNILASGTPNALPVGQQFVALAASANAAPPLIFVATAAGVWVSNDNGTTWRPDVVGLPTMPNCWDMRTVTEASGAEFVYLSTFGWSAYRRLINFPALTQTLAVVGHMDIVDRVAFTKDLWAHPTFTHITSIGPLEPLAQWTTIADVGDEIQVVLKVNGAWAGDRSVRLDYNAKLISKDEDNDVSDHAEGQQTVAFGATDHVVIDMASDEFWPDRAHVEFAISNT